MYYTGRKTIDQHNLEIFEEELRNIEGASICQINKRGINHRI